MNSILARIPQMLRRIGCCAALALCTMAVGFALPASAAPSVSTDRIDYPPFSDVYITGAGYQPGETVLVHIDQLNSDGSRTALWDAAPSPVADINGSFTVVWFIFSDEFIGATLEVIAAGPLSGIATATFTDALDCPAPPNGTAPVNIPTGGFGIDGDLLANIPTSGVGDWVENSTTGGFVLLADGTPVDSTTTFHFIDPFDSSTDDNFAGGNKADDDPNTWSWVRNPVLAKDDMNHALVHISKDSSNHTWVMIAGDRRSENGDSYIDFEFLQNEMTVNANGTFTSSGPHGGRTTNDFILTLNFTGGGKTAGLCVSRWAQVGVKMGVPQYDYVSATVPSGAVFAAVNTNTISVPYGAFGGTTYAANLFAEAAVDLTALLGTFNECLTVGVKTIFVKTKTSQSPSATIVDFITPFQPRPPLVIGPAADAGQDKTKCTEGATTSFTLTGSVQPGINPLNGTNWTVVSGPAMITGPTSNSLTTTVVVTGAMATATVRLAVMDAGQCTNNFTSDDVVLTVNPLPSCGITNTTPPVTAGATETFKGPDGMMTYAWTVAYNGGGSSPVGGNSQTVNIVIPLISGSVTVGLTITNANGCTSSCSDTESINPPADCIVSLGPPTCPGTIQTYQLAVTPPPGAMIKWTITNGNPCAFIVGPDNETNVMVNSLTCCTNGLHVQIINPGPTTNTCDTLVQFMDSTAPTITCAAVISPIQCPAMPAFPPPTVSDNCDPAPVVTFADVTTPGACPQEYSVTRTWTVTDKCGNVASCSRTVVVRDTTAPSISALPGPTTIECPATPSFATPTATDACDPSPTLTFADVTTAGSCPQNHDVTRTWTAINHCGNSSTASQVIHVVDTTAPVISTVPGPTTIQCPATPSFATPTAT
ncbi:MAG TPA: hypothetical protein VFT34_00345, partial [Verrucomicrobiae bacterium]|nr:hypothetical protein [Verrucomicrobiae bacterium]